MQPRFASGFDGEHEPITRTLATGDVLFTQGDPPDDIYIIESGALEVVRTAATGESVTLAQVGAGDFIGEMGPLFGLPRSATVRATEPTTVVAHSPASFRDEIGVDSLGDIIAGRGST